MADTCSMKRMTGSLWTVPLALTLAITGCGGIASTDTASGTAGDTTASADESTSTERETISDDTDNGHAIAVSGEEASYTAVDVTKTGEADGDEADFYGTTE